MKKIISKNEDKTISVGIALGKKCTGGEIFSLSGNLGSGKTILSKGIARGLGIKKHITSPTFIILNIYKTKSYPKKIKKLIHIDAYRLESKKDLENIGFFDFIKEKDNIIIIEWGEKIKKYLPIRTKKIKLLSLKNGNKKIIIF